MVKYLKSSYTVLIQSAPIVVKIIDTLYTRITVLYLSSEGMNNIDITKIAKATTVEIRLMENSSDAKTENLFLSSLKYTPSLTEYVLIPNKANVAKYPTNAWAN